MRNSSAEVSAPLDPAVLLALAERCETEGASWQLECAIAEAVGWYTPEQGYQRSAITTPKYTTSLDAAATLVPKGDDAFWRLGHDGEGPDPSAFKAQVLVCRVATPVSGFYAVADTPALALCAAALRARAALSKGA